MTRRILVPFAGDGGGTDTLSWGQWEIWRSMTAVGDSFSLGGVVPLPVGTTVDDVITMLRFMVSRHQSLRTRIVVDPDGRVRQTVADSGTVPIDVVDVAGDGAAAAARRVLARFEGVPFDHANEWPVRMAVVRRDGVCTHLVTAYSHVALDAYGLDALVVDLLGGATPVGEVTGAQPLAQARQQRTATALRHSEAALRHAERVLRTAPASRFPKSEQPQVPRWWQLGYRSPASHQAALAVAARAGVHTTPVLLAGFAVALCELTGAEAAVVRLMVSNRFRPGFAGSVSPVAQACLGVVEVGDRTFDQVVAGAWRTLTQAGRHAYFDPNRMAELVARVRQERGDDVAIASFNDRRRPNRSATPEAAPTGPVPAAGVLRWERALTTYDHTLNLHINNVVDEPRDAVDYQLCADTRHLSPDDMAAMVRRIEDVIVTAVSYDDTKFTTDGQHCALGSMSSEGGPG